MAYTPPSLKVYQEFSPLLTSNTLPLYACIAAPQYGMHRFTVDAEKASLGDYDAVAGNAFTAWPDSTSGSTIDVATSALWMEDAKVRYDLFSLTGTDKDPGAGTSWDGLLTNGGNKIRSHYNVFRTANGTSRSSRYGTRDVALGDYVKVTYGATTVETTVAGVEADVDAATIGAITAAATNQAAVAAASAVVTEHIASSEFTVTASAASYDGLADGNVEETYTVTVIATDGTLEGTTVRIASASGNDDVAAQLLNGSGVANTLGSRGATFTITSSPSLASTSSESSNSSSSQSSLVSSSSQSISSSSSSQSSNTMSESSSSSNTDRKLVVGDYFTADCEMQYTVPSPVEGGTYAGSRDTTYILTVSEGGTIGTDSVKFLPTTTNGYDSAIEIVASAAGTYAAGNYGAEFTVNAGEQYDKGDVYTIAVTAEADGAIKTVILADKLTGAVTTTPLSVTFGLIDTFRMDSTNWTASTGAINVAAAARHTAAYLGTTATFAILAADMYVDYRELLTANTTMMASLDDVADVEAALGPIVPENPLALMVYCALLGSDGTPVYYIGVEADTVAGYTEALSKLTDVSEPYSIVAYNTSEDVSDIVQAHVLAMSTPDKAEFRIMWRGIDVERIYGVYTEEAGSEILSAVTGTALTSSNAKFVTNGIAAGDYVRINYRVDGVGATIYDTYTVASVVSEDELTLVAGPSSPLVVEVKTEIWRNASLAQYAANISAVATHHVNRRVRAVWSEPLEIAGFADLSKAYLCALLAGMRSAAAPHQPLSRVTVPYITLDTQANFGATYLNSMAGNGVWLVVESVDGTAYTRHQLTTDPTDLYTSEDTITTNLDHISRDYRDAVSDLYGKGNVSTAMLRLIEGRVAAMTSQILGRSYSDIIGPQMDSIKVTRLEIDTSLKDQIWVEFEPVLPAPLNHLVLKFRLV